MDDGREVVMGAGDFFYIPFVDNVNTAVQNLTPAIHRLSPASAKGIQVVNALGDASPALKSILVNLEQLKPSATQALPAIHSLLCQANPMIRFLSPYGSDIAAFFENFGAATDAYGAAAGHQMLTVATVDPTAIFRGLYSQPVNSALSTLFNFGIFHKLGGSIFGYRPLNPPGQRNDTTTGLGVRSVFQYGQQHPFPHVTADCTS
jgi:phospholipid/cholesterol/gamma-HCH transport system substrate-binding protein